VTDEPGNTLSRSEETSAPTARSAPALIVVAECERPRAGAARHLLADVDEVVIGRGQRAFSRDTSDGKQRILIGVPDPWMSTTHCRLVRSTGHWFVEDLGSRNGVVLDGARTERALLTDGALLELGHTFFLFRASILPADGDPDDLDSTQLVPSAPGLPTLHAELGRELHLLARVASSELPVIVLGESGVGKEVVARALHELSGRTGAFVAVNCGALSDSLRESELFGHRRGAFTGAVQDHVGFVRSADGGTLFLDEIGDLPLSAQVALLRALQERQVTPVGTTRPIPVDLRVCVATHRDLEAMVERESFRADLFARLSGFTLLLPPLRERREDLGLLIGTLLERTAPQATALRFAPEAMRALLSYPWPLNVRELEKALARAVTVCDGDVVRLEHLPPTVRSAMPRAPRSDAAAAGAVGDGSAAEPQVDAVARREQLVALLAEHAGNISAIARIMKTSRVQIRRWLKRYQLDLDSYRS
jgi:transcriptional regulator with AAA-type ATPase domain